MRRTPNHCRAILLGLLFLMINGPELSCQTKYKLSEAEAKFQIAVYEKMERNYGHIQTMYNLMRSLKSANRSFRFDLQRRNIGLRNSVNIDSCQAMNESLRKRVQATRLPESVLQDNWEEFEDDEKRMVDGGNLFSTEALFLAKVPKDTALSNKLKDLVQEYDAAMSSFGRRCSRFVAHCYERCAKMDYVDEEDLTRIDMAIATLELRKTEIQDYYDSRYIRSQVAEIADDTQIISETVVNNSQVTVLQEMKEGFAKLAPRPVHLGPVFSFHSGIPNNHGASATANIPVDTTGMNSSFFSLTGIVLLNADSTSVHFGGQAGGMTRKFGGRIGILFSTADHEPNYSPFVSILFRRKRFLVGFDLSRYHQGVSIGCSLK